MSKFTIWCTPCPECDYREYAPNAANLIGPIFHETGDKCPKCGSGIKIVIRNQGGPTAYAEAVKA